MSTTETKTASGVILAPDLATRYKLAEAQLALIPPIDEDDAEEWAGLRQHCEEVMLSIERLSAAEEQLAEAKRSLAHKDAHYNASLDNLLRMNTRSEERERVLRGLVERYRQEHAERNDGAGWCALCDDADAALATPAPEPSEQNELGSPQEIEREMEDLRTKYEAMEKENAALKAQVARLSAPVTDEEINAFPWGFVDVVKARFDLIMAARTAPAKETE